MQIIVPPIQFLLSTLYYFNNVTVDHLNPQSDSNFRLTYHDNRVSLYNNITNRNSGFLWWRKWLRREEGSGGILGSVTNVWADTTKGKVKGVRQISRNGRPYALFRGIPYAKPPVGDKRYEPSEPHDGWEGELDATRFGSQCMQINVITRRVIGDEDCLFLNVATRKTYTKDSVQTVKKQDLHPVIFFIHGGLFMFGSANPFGTKYFLDEDVVLVSINYRLNSFGFLNTGDDSIMGNMGLKDQNLALRWVQENIKFFNGDPTRVTLLGESAGAACVHYHTLSPMSRGLFSGAVSLSGTALSPWGQILQPRRQSNEFAEELGCPTNDTSEMKTCLQSLTAQQVASYHLGYMHKASEGRQSVFGPTVELPDEDPLKKSERSDVFLPAKALDMIRQGDISDRPWITGVNSADGLVYLIAILRNDTLRKKVNSKWDHYAPQLLAYHDHPEAGNITKDVNKFYLGGQDLNHDNIKEQGELFSDRGFFVDGHDVAIMQSRVAPVYAYYYSYEGVCSLGNMLFTRANYPLIPSDMSYVLGGGTVWLKSMLLNRRQKNEFGVFHGDEMPLLFNIPMIRREVTPRDEDYNMSKKLVALFTSFAETGKPDMKRMNVDEPQVNWETVRTTNPGLEDKPLMRLELNEPFSIKEEPFYERMLFWKNRSISYICGENYENKEHKNVCLYKK